MAERGFDVEKIDRYFKGEYSEKDASYVDDVFCDIGKEKELRHHLSGQFDKLASDDESDILNLDHILYKIHYEINVKQTEINASKISGFPRWPVLIAGIIILPFALFLGIRGYINNSIGKETWIEINAAASTRTQFSLPDGTTGWLNCNSSIKYNGNFNIDRQVTLKGEAFFDVFKDKNRPFTVNTNEINVKVLGTRFNIASYENEKHVEVVLEEGKLIFNNKEMNKSYTMKPNDLVIYDKALKDYSTTEVEPQTYLSWTDGKLIFRNDPLDVIARRLERWYDIDVEVNGCLAEDLRLRATFVNESLEQVLYFLKRSLPINYSIENHGLKPDETYVKKKVIITLRTK